MIEKIQVIPVNYSVELLTINKIKYFIISNKLKNVLKFFKLHSKIEVNLIKINMISLKFNAEYNNFFNFFERWLLNCFSVKTKKILIRGLGLKVSFNEHKNVLILKLGFSHLSYLHIPIAINISLLKKRILLESSDSVALGNFSFRLRLLKKPNIYKGKGLWSKGEIINLKSFKK